MLSMKQLEAIQERVLIAEYTHIAELTPHLHVNASRAWC